MPMAHEQQVRTRTVYAGKLVSLRVDTVIGADGREHQWEVVEHPGAVAILPVLPDGRLLLVRQYRHAVGQELLEAPAGLPEPGESDDDAARRELREETGYRAGRLERLCRYFSSPGFTTETIVVYVARELEAGEPDRDPGEEMELEPVAPGDVAEMIASGRIIDGHTIVALLAFLGLRLPAD